MATIYEVAKLASVSLATVSRVINKNAQVSDKTREKVLEAMLKLDYRPNSLAQSLASNRTNCVGILVSELYGPFFGQMMAGIEAELRAAGKYVIFTTGHSELDKEKEAIDFLISRNCDALIVHVEAVTDEYLTHLNQGKFPVYMVGRLVEGLEDKCISLQNESGGYLATKMVIEQGHTDIAYIAGPQFKPDAKARVAGHKRALAEHNIAFNDALYYEGNFKETGGSEGLQQLLAKDASFSALICSNDEMASGAITYARERGIALPQELSIIGFDNIDFSQHIYPKLTTIDNPIHEMGSMAAKLVLRDVYKQEIKVIKHSFEPKVIIRDSLQTLG